MLNVFPKVIPNIEIKSNNFQVREQFSELPNGIIYTLLTGFTFNHPETHTLTP